MRRHDIRRSSSIAGSNPRRKPVPRQAGVSLIEVLVILAIVVLLLAMLVPNLSMAREQGRRIQCRNNLRQWGIAAQFYRDDNNDYLPTEGTYLHPDEPYTWFNVLPPYLNAPAYREVEGVGRDIREFPELHMWICPSKNLSIRYKSDSGKNQFHYAMNLVLDGIGGSADFPDEKNVPIRASRYRKWPHTVFLFDVYSNVSCGAQRDVGASFHRGIAHVLMLSGAVLPFQAGDFVVDGNFKNPVPIWNHPQMYWGYRPASQDRPPS